MKLQIINYEVSICFNLSYNNFKKLTNTYFFNNNKNNTNNNTNTNNTTTTTTSYTT